MTLLKLASARTFVSLRRHHNYRLFFFGQLTSVCRDVDAEHRACLARRSARAALARPRGRRALVLPLRAVHAPRPARRRRHRPVRQSPHRDRHAVGADALLRDPRGRHARRARPAVGGLRDRSAHGHRARVRCAVAPEPHLPDGRTRRAAERDRAQLEPLQHSPHLRPGAGGRPDRRGRRRLVLRDQLGQLPRRAGEPARDARERALPAPRPPPADALARHPRRLSLRAPQPDRLGDPDDDGDLLVDLLQLQHPAAAAREGHARRRARAPSASSPPASAPVR